MENLLMLNGLIVVVFIIAISINQKKIKERGITL